MKYRTLAELQQAYRTGALDREEHPLVIDNDQCFVYVEDEKVFSSGGPHELIEEALTLLLIPYMPA